MIAIISVYMTPAGDSYDEAVATFDDSERETAEKIRNELMEKEKHRLVTFEIQPYRHSPPPPHNPQTVADIGRYWDEQTKKFIEDV